jgi:hypothetical protein
MAKDNLRQRSYYVAQAYRIWEDIYWREALQMGALRPAFFGFFELEKTYHNTPRRREQQVIA